MLTSPLVSIDPWLEPHLAAIIDRRQHTRAMRQRLVGDQSLVEFAQGYHYFGLHKTSTGWVFREWLPNATSVFLIGDFSDWTDEPDFALKQGEAGVWEINLPTETLHHETLYKLHVYWQDGDGERIPAYATRVVQDPDTLVFNAQVWAPEQPYEWQHTFTRQADTTPYIYEAHIGMSGEKEAVTSVLEFTRDTLPRIIAGGYNTIQLMAVQEHPYYGSFGYHVSSLFAASSRFGTPEDFKALIDTAHANGIAVIIDLVHSHAVKNETEGLSRQDGTYHQYFHDGARGNHSAWDSRLFDYGKPEVAHFLLSNCRYWLDEYHFDGFRFDGVTSMLYTDHGLEKSFTSYDDYFNNLDLDAASYLTLANQLIHDFRPDALTIAEDMSGLPGLATTPENDGIGFDYRLSMGTPDHWIRLIKEASDESWSVSQLLHELSAHRPEEKTISYAESHDQALVGDKTIMFRLADSSMYTGMSSDHHDPVIDRAMALHKLIRLMTAGLHQGGYLTFMGNEFGHPEWIDFPREGNDWSYAYARRQWSLVDNPQLKYHLLGDFDRALMTTLKTHNEHMQQPVSWTTSDDSDQVLSFMRGDLLFAINLSPTKSYDNYGLFAPAGDYTLQLSSDDAAFGGFDHIQHDTQYYTDGSDRHLQVYLPARTAIILRRTV